MELQRSHEQAQLWSQGDRPAWMKPLERPVPVARACELAFLIFEKPDLEKSERFCTDFGMLCNTRTKDELLMRGAGPSPAVYMARRAYQARYVGAVFVASSAKDLQDLRQQAHAQDSYLAGRWGCDAAMLFDPAGNEVHMLHDHELLNQLSIHSDVLASGVNSPLGTRRINQSLRPPLLPAQVIKCSHVVLQVENFAANAHWYMRTLGLIPSDIQVLADGSPNLAFFRLDCGAQPVDHHTVVLAGGIENRYMHSAYEVSDLDAMGQGHQFLRSKKWHHSWGMGRHYIGSQLFDYWLDPDGFEMEHMADSDRYDNTVEPFYSIFDRKSLWMWGQDLPKHMSPPKNPMVLLKVIQKVFSGRLDSGRVKQIVSAMKQPPRSWLT
jgi:hypothetical protein